MGWYECFQLYFGCLDDSKCHSGAFFSSLLSNFFQLMLGDAMTSAPVLPQGFHSHDNLHCVIIYSFINIQNSSLFPGAPVVLRGCEADAQTLPRK